MDKSRKKELLKNSKMKRNVNLKTHFLLVKKYLKSYLIV